jgi:hypothetical protein
VKDALDARNSSDCFPALVDSLRVLEPDNVAIAGRTAADMLGDTPLLRLISVRATQQRLVIGQEARAVGCNEIAVVPPLLKRPRLTRARVSTDAMGCQPAIAEAAPAIYWRSMTIYRRHPAVFLTAVAYT